MVQILSTNNRHGARNTLLPNPQILRKTLQFGPLFLFQTRSFAPASEYIEIPPEFTSLIVKLKQYSKEINHIVVNEYLPGQGIKSHIDSPDLFGAVIVSLSLLSDCVMTFTRKESGGQVQKFLKRRSLVVLDEEARFEWGHEISKDLVELIDGLEVSTNA